MKCTVTILMTGLIFGSLTCRGNKETTGEKNAVDSLMFDTSTVQLASPVLYEYTYRCADDVFFTVQLDPIAGTALLLLDTVEYKLIQDTVASGIRYTNETITFYSKGDSAFITHGDTFLFQDCISSGGRDTAAELR